MSCEKSKYLFTLPDTSHRLWSKMPKNVDLFLNKKFQNSDFEKRLKLKEMTARKLNFVCFLW